MNRQRAKTPRGKEAGKSGIQILERVLPQFPLASLRLGGSLCLLAAPPPPWHLGESPRTRDILSWRLPTMSRRDTRREFLKTTTMAGLSAPRWLNAVPAIGRTSANEKVRFACIGVGGKGDSDTNDAGSHGEIIALCDCDENTLDAMASKYP